MVYYLFEETVKYLYMFMATFQSSIPFQSTNSWIRAQTDAKMEINKLSEIKTKSKTNGTEVRINHFRDGL